MTGLLVPFDQILDALSQKLNSLTGRQLDDKAREFLYSIIDLDQQRSDKVDAVQFSKFWHLYYVMLKIVLHPGVKPLFRDGFVHGFVSATLSTKLLVDAGQEGTAIIRFSTSRPGCLVITCMSFSPLFAL